jgi:4-diphosphocytidyl-2-C-methyl-D-erythritol kinase
LIPNLSIFLSQLLEDFMINFPNAKINLGLYITEKRSDGYHNLETVFLPVKVCDALECIAAEDLNLQLHGLPVAGSQQKNLVWKAWQLLKVDFPVLIKPVAIHLLKNIPMGAGLGGGSADGAFMLQLLNNMFALNLSAAQLSAYAIELGSDCPFFIYNQPCMAKGRGEILTPIDLDLSEYSIQLVCPEVHITTAAAFANIKPKPANINLAQLPSIGVSEWKDVLYNDFETTIFTAHPKLAALKQSLYEQGAIYAAMSGTGSTIYGIFEKGKEAAIDLEIPYKVFYQK